MTVKARCPVCDSLVGISPTPDYIGKFGTARWWLVDVHASAGKVCDGSGRKV